MSTPEASKTPGGTVDEPAERGRKPALRQVIGAGVAIVTIVAVFAFLLPRIADYHDVWAVMSKLSTGGAHLRRIRARRSL